MCVFCQNVEKESAYFNYEGSQMTMFDLNEIVLYIHFFAHLLNSFGDVHHELRVAYLFSFKTFTPK